MRRCPTYPCDIITCGAENIFSLFYCLFEDTTELKATADTK